MKNTRNTEGSMRTYYEEWKSRGISMKAFSRENELPYSTFSYWVRKFSSDGGLAAGFVELNVGSSEGSLNPTPEVEIEYRSGTKVRFYRLTDTSVIKSLI
jgi:hypothetical protein